MEIAFRPVPTGSVGVSHPPRQQSCRQITTVATSVGKSSNIPNFVIFLYSRNPRIRIRCFGVTESSLICYITIIGSSCIDNQNGRHKSDLFKFHNVYLLSRFPRLVTLINKLLSRGPPEHIESKLRSLSHPLDDVNVNLSDYVTTKVWFYNFRCY